MPKRTMSEEQRRAASERMKAMHAKKAQERLTEAYEEKTTLNPGITEEAKETISNPEVEELKRQIAELHSMIKPQAPQGVQMSHRGSLVGTVEKYRVDPALYPNPIERLANEPKLQRFGIKGGPLSDFSYELEFHTGISSYETRDGIRMKEPKFTLELHRVVYDEETGEATNGRYVVCRLIMHEDPEAALVIARDNGIEVDETNEEKFLNEMRYLRMRDWLMEAFYPVRSAPKQNKKDMAIGGKLVEYFEVNSENPEIIPFGQLRTKV
jgi:hypothetical protein